jgi:DNA-directed RNA polymerase specialized sigma24 family protein
VLSLHQAGCDGRHCVPDKCIADVEKLARSVLSAHERGGVKRNGSLDRPGMTLTESDREDLLAYLVSTAWQLAQKFEPGRGRLAGYVVQNLHRRLIDWTRVRFGSARYPSSKIVAVLVTLTPEIEERFAPFLDPEFDDGDCGLDLDAAPAGTREALELLQPLIDDETVTIAQAADRARVKPGEVTQALVLVRAAARQQGLARHVDEECHALADQAADLRRRRMTYQEIADALGLRSGSVALTLIRGYHPELVKSRTLKTRGADASSLNGSSAAA